jgi:hypothetical protein
MNFRILSICFVLFFASILFPSTASAQLKKVIDKVSTATGGSSNPSPAEMANGLKEALEKGTGLSVDRLNLENGFLGNATIKLLFPPEARKVEKALRGIGMNKACDDFILTINRAAELAAKEAKPLFISAIKEMSVQDASNILMSGT